MTGLDEIREFSIAAQPLDAALIAFSEQAEMQVLVATNLVEGLESQPVQGEYEGAEALAALLDGHNLGFEAIAADTVAVSRREGDDGGKSRPASKQTPAKQVQSSESERHDGDGNQGDREATRTSTDEIIVTGSHLGGPQVPGSRIITIDQEEIEYSGYTSTEQLIQSLPQNFRGGAAGATADLNMSVGSLRRLNATAGSGVNLRGLGSTATLVLVNGRRISASSAGTFTDISMIPLGAIERIEVLTEGASAIYGADAVAGVINIILRKDYDSAESRLRYGSASGREEHRFTQSFGTGWDGGGMSLAFDYLDEGQLLSSERDFTARVIQPTSIFPANELMSLILTRRQEFGERWSADADIQHARSERHLISSNTFSTSLSEIEPRRTNINLGVNYEAFGDWTVSLDASTSEEDTETRLEDADRATGLLNYSYVQTQTQDQWGVELRADGSILELPSGPVKLALGSVYREEDYFRHIDLYGTRILANREVASAFFELYVPIVGNANAMPGIAGLELALAGRHDDYSDFGSTDNPRIGITWSPTGDLDVRASYSTSYRAPSTGRELVESDRGVFGVEVAPFFAADGEGFVPVIMLIGSTRLVPEESTNWTFGFTWEPSFAQDLSLGLSYYDISYTNRIIVPPFDSGALSDPTLQAFLQYFDSPAEAAELVESYTAQGAYFADFTGGMFGPDPMSQVTAAYAYLWMNAERVDVSGFDATVSYPFNWGDNRISVGLNANYIEEMINVPAPGAPAYDLVDTFGNPADLRFRGTMSWSRGDLSGALNVNHTGTYTDTSGVDDRPVDAYTTVDATLRYAFGRGDSWLEGISLALVLTNMLDEEPPYVESSGLGANYDGANANPLGRVIAVEIAKQW